MVTRGQVKRGSMLTCRVSLGSGELAGNSCKRRRRGGKQDARRATLSSGWLSPETGDKHTTSLSSVRPCPLLKPCRTVAPSVPRSSFLPRGTSSTTHLVGRTMVPFLGQQRPGAGEQLWRFQFPPKTRRRGPRPGRPAHQSSLACLRQRLRTEERAPARTHLCQGTAFWILSAQTQSLFCYCTFVTTAIWYQL